ncbi:DUF1697 domain-containing protein [Streptomyces sp. SS8]
MTGRPERYAALLRGIDVGGNKKVPMAEPREVMAGLGRQDARTYVNSGNVVFTAGRRDTGEPAAGLPVLFLGREPDRGRLAAVDAAAYAPDEFRVGEREPYRWFPDGMGRSKLPGALETACRGTTVTGRNRRTVTGLPETVSS